MWLRVCSNDHASLTVMPYIIFFFKIRMIFSLVAMTRLEKCCITSAYLQWLYHSGEWLVARGPLVSCLLCKSKILWNISIILGRNVEQDQTTCRVQEWQLCLSYFWRNLPLLYLTVIIHWFHVSFVSQRPFRGSFGCASDWRPGGRGFDPAEVGNILSWRLIMKYFLWSFSPFRWFKKSSCHFLAKECAQYWLIT